VDELVFSVKEAKQFNEQGKIEQWVHLFLNSVGKNKPFSEGLKLQQRYWLGPILIRLDQLHRCCGAEQGIKYQQPVEHWENSVSKMQKLIQEGWDMPPLIVNHSEGYLEVSDGNHRLEALIREGVKEFWVILWDSDDQDNLRTYMV
jgi:hypothetical protein